MAFLPFKHVPRVPPPSDSKTPEERRFYGSALWKRTREAHRAEEPLCRTCAAAGITRLGQMVDHIKRIRDGGDKTDPANLQTLCNLCHNRKRQQEGRS